MSISDEEFQRFQNQLVELRNRNYQLEEQNKKLAKGQPSEPFPPLTLLFILPGNVQSQTPPADSKKDSISQRLSTIAVSVDVGEENAMRINGVLASIETTSSYWT